MLLLNLALADPYFPGGQVPPPAGTLPPEISINLENNTLLRSSNISIPLIATPGGLSASTGVGMFDNVWYEDDWQEGNFTIPNLEPVSLASLESLRWNITSVNLASLSGNITLAGVPDGNHTLTVFAEAEGNVIDFPYADYFYIVGSSSVNFTVDSVTPTISFLSSEQNKTYDTRDVTLGFVLNKPASQIIYCLDNKGNVTVKADSSLTLDNLSNGEHNVTIYSVDEYGVVSAPSTVYFSVEPSPTLAIIVVASTAALVAVLSVGLLVCRKRRKH